MLLAALNANTKPEVIGKKIQGPSLSRQDHSSSHETPVGFSTNVSLVEPLCVTANPRHELPAPGEGVGVDDDQPGRCSWRKDNLAGVPSEAGAEGIPGWECSFLP